MKLNFGRIAKCKKIAGNWRNRERGLIGYV
jgi:hypothetical protein